ncbi:LLM class flavin-dependent oxidoreductase [Actinoplanes subtropicus]|uniref:LLM class flavin-dependent oxidoreductase n=1 Tax=Actinoplanes subtropicus TaxID=543632 RepID=UPI0004C4489A|nr:LLM class flavin-dependent oxidoreductase [Actinoplanes subtropicus]
MEISIGLPNTLRHPGPLMIEWARRAEERGFTSLGTIDRIVYPNYDTIASLCVAAGATSRIGLLSGVLLTPLYPPVWLAKAAAGLDAMSGGRLTLGLGVGGREDDFVAMGRSMRERGQNMDAALEIMRTVFAGEKLPGDAFPVAEHGHPKVLIGGTSDAAVRRTVEHGQGWIAGGASPAQVKPMVDRIRREWHDAGREGEPRFAGLAYFGLSDEETSKGSLRSYYGFLGDFADVIANGALRSPQALQEAIKAFEEAGLDELILDPTVPDLAEVDRLADAVF